MRPIINTRAVRAIAVTGTLSFAIPFAAMPAAAQTESQGTQDAVTTTGGTTTEPSGTTAVAASAATQKRQARIRIARATRNVIAGSRASVRGTLTPGKAGRTVTLQLNRGHGWSTVDKARTRSNGSYRVYYRTHDTGSVRWRVRFAGDRTAKPVTRSVGRLNMFRRANASWYGQYGGPLACGGTLGYNTQGVAHKTLPCGTRVTLRYKGRTVRVRVIDRGPYVGGRDFDLTGATKRSLGFGDLGTVLSTR